MVENILEKWLFFLAFSASYITQGWTPSEKNYGLGVGKPQYNLKGLWSQILSSLVLWLEKHSRRPVRQSQTTGFQSELFCETASPTAHWDNHGSFCWGTRSTTGVAKIKAEIKRHHGNLPKRQACCWLASKLLWRREWAFPQICDPSFCARYGAGSQGTSKMSKKAPVLPDRCLRALYLHIHMKHVFRQQVSFTHLWWSSLCSWQPGVEVS